MKLLESFDVKLEDETLGTRVADLSTWDLAISNDNERPPSGRYLRSDFSSAPRETDFELMPSREGWQVGGSLVHLAARFNRPLLHRDHSEKPVVGLLAGMSERILADRVIRCSQCLPTRNGQFISVISAGSACPWAIHLKLGLHDSHLPAQRKG